ncbi:MAG: zinc metallopeptidase [Merdibacter sp.]
MAAHECGHAIQHKENYAPLKIRDAMVPAVNLANRSAGSRCSLV